VQNLEGDPSRRRVLARFEHRTIPTHSEHADELEALNGYPRRRRVDGTGRGVRPQSLHPWENSL
jgi:hypothetical protein